jgi:hypothetical protein
LSNWRRKKPCIQMRTLKIERKLKLPDRLMVITSSRLKRAIKFQKIKESTTPKSTSRWFCLKVPFTN